MKNNIIKTKLMVFIAFLCLFLTFYGASAVEVNSSTEIYTFNVTDCDTNVSSVGCEAKWIRFNCSIVPHSYIDYVEYEIDDIYYETDRDMAHFYYDWYKEITTEDTNTQIEWQKVKIYDVGGGIAQYFPSLEITHICDACDYNITYGECNISDQRIVQYEGDGSPNCTSYNTTESCDYCTPDWEITSECQKNNTEYRTYNDLNNCYATTGLYSDSCSYWFTDCDTWISCSYLKNEMDCGYDSEPLIEIGGNRIFWYCSIDNTTPNYSCISYVKLDGHTIQTNPQKQSFSSGLFNREQEDREFFTAQNGLVNPYFTTDNLKHNTTYIFGVECSYNNGKLVQEEYITPIYENLDVVAYRGVWLQNNIGYILGAFIVGIVGIIIIMWVIR